MTTPPKHDSKNLREYTERKRIVIGRQCIWRLKSRLRRNVEGEGWKREKIRKCTSHKANETFFKILKINPN